MTLTLMNSALDCCDLDLERFHIKMRSTGIILVHSCVVKDYVTGNHFKGQLGQEQGFKCIWELGLTLTLLDLEMRMSG